MKNEFPTLLNPSSPALSTLTRSTAAVCCPIQRTGNHRRSPSPHKHRRKRVLRLRSDTENYRSSLPNSKDGQPSHRRSAGTNKHRRKIILRPCSNSLTNYAMEDELVQGKRRKKDLQGLFALEWGTRLPKRN
jgi:hypothetical protein